MPLVSNSLRRQLVVRLSVPLLGLMVLGAVLSFMAARHFASAVHDEGLYDSAMSLAAQIRPEEGAASLSLPEAAVEMLEWDHTDSIYYEVVSPSHGRIFGNAALPPPPNLVKNAIPGDPRYFDGEVDGMPVRVGMVSVPAATAGEQGVTVAVAETLHKRDAVIRSIMLAMLPLEGGLVLLAGGLIWVTVTSALRTLNGLSQRLSSLDAGRLEPLTEEGATPAEVRPLVSALNQLIRRLASAYEAQRRFVSNAAHQLRTPLAAMQVQTERALREADPAKQVEALADIRIAMVRLKHMTQQLLTLARAEPEAARMLEMSDIDLAELTRDALEAWTDTAISKSVDLGYDGPASGVRVQGEPQLLRELIGNLVDNAIRYGRQGGTVTVHLTRAPVTLAIEDDGPGIPESERNHVTERFYRMPSSGGGGSGLGLAIAAEIASRHNATLAISTPKDGQGTRVSITFSDATIAEPRTRAKAQAAESAASRLSSGKAA
jgi:two-component system sensor histidine kinase TctE